MRSILFIVLLCAFLLVNIDSLGADQNNYEVELHFHSQSTPVIFRNVQRNYKNSFPVKRTIKIVNYQIENSQPPPKKAVKKPKSRFPKKLPNKRGPASFHSGFRTSTSPCDTYSVPNMGSPRRGQIKKGKKLWLEGIDDLWVRAKSGKSSVYLLKSCF